MLGVFCSSASHHRQHAIAVSELAAAWSFLVEVFDVIFRRGGGAAVFAPRTSGTTAVPGPLCDAERSGAARVGSRLKDVDVQGREHLVVSSCSASAIQTTS